MEIVGGGPGGLLAARLLARGGYDVAVSERLEPGETYGFGVALAPPALKRLHEQDPIAAERIREICHPLDRWTMVRGEESISVGGQEAYGLSRSKLLETLGALAVEAGARVRGGTRASIGDMRDADIVIFADGVSSHGREALAAELGAEIATAALCYNWCGAGLRLDAMTLDLRRTTAGVFCGHVMPFGDGRCTFQIDAVPEAVAAAGLREDDAAATDEDSLGFLGDVFRATLHGEELLGNASRWSRFVSVKCERWSHGKFVLLGDAAHTAHYTVGSGTRMAMEDAMSLSQALVQGGGFKRALEDYEADRRPAVEHLQFRASRSLDWWRTIAQRFDVPLPTLMFSYFTRTGVGLRKLFDSDPAIVEAAIAERAKIASATGLVLSDAFEFAWDGMPKNDALKAVVGGRVTVGRRLPDCMTSVSCDGIQPWSPSSVDLVESLVATSADSRDVGVVLRGAAEIDKVVGRFDIAEELKARLELPVFVSAPAWATDEVVTGLISARSDYVVVE